MNARFRSSRCMSTGIKNNTGVEARQYLHNSSGYSKFKRSTEKRKKTTLYRQQQNGKSILGQINSDNSHAFSPTGYPLPLRMRSETSHGLKHLTRDKYTAGVQIANQHFHFRFRFAKSMIYLY